MTDSVTHDLTRNPTHNLTDNVSPLARRLADTHDVDLSALAKGPDDKITARNVLEHLSTTAEPAKRRGESSLLPETGPSTETAPETVAVATDAPAQSLKNVTAQVHQQTMMQVGSLRERNSALEQETERLRAAEAQAQAELQRLAEQKAQLERELERLAQALEQRDGRLAGVGEQRVDQAGAE